MCVAKVLTLCRVHVREAAAPVGISTGEPYCNEKDRPLCLCVSFIDRGLSNTANQDRRRLCPEIHSVTYV